MKRFELSTLSLARRCLPLSYIRECEVLCRLRDLDSLHYRRAMGQDSIRCEDDAMARNLKFKACGRKLDHPISSWKRLGAEVGKLKP